MGCPAFRHRKGLTADAAGRSLQGSCSLPRTRPRPRSSPSPGGRFNVGFSRGRSPLLQTRSLAQSEAEVRSRPSKRKELREHHTDGFRPALCDPTRSLSRGPSLALGNPQLVPVKPTGLPRPQTLEEPPPERTRGYATRPASLRRLARGPSAAEPPHLDGSSRLVCQRPAPSQT